MKIQINVRDFYLDDDDNIEEGLKRHIMNEAINSIFQKIKDKVAVEIKKGVEDQVLANLSSEIAKAVKDGKIKNKSDNALVTVKEYVADCLVSSSESSWQSFEKIIKDISKNFCDEMRRRYDVSFASNIVAKLIDNKLIKDDAVKMLLGEKK